MIDFELLEKTLIKLYPITEEMTEDEVLYLKDLRDIFKAGVQWGFDHPYFDKGCVKRIWHYLTEDPSVLPEVNKVCLIKFSDGTGCLSSMVYDKSPSLQGGYDPSTPADSNIDPGQPLTPGSGFDPGDDTQSDPVSPNKHWVVKYRDDIIAWSYYINE